MSEYLMVLVVSGFVPFILSFYPPLVFYRNIRALLASIFFITIIFGAWDVFATYRGHWHFKEEALMGITILNLPLEEVLFFVIIPFCCIFSWEVVNYFKNKRR